MRRLLLLILLTGAAQAQVSVPLTPGWNGVAFQNAQVTDIPANSSLAGQATWDGTAYQTGPVTPAAVNAGEGTRRGFWVFATQATTLSYTGTGQGNSLNLRSGYNLVSFASSPPITALTAQQNGQTVPLGSVVLTTFTQIDANGQYTPVNMGSGGVLQPGRPYWVFANGNVTLNWTPTSPSPSPSPAGSPPGSFNLQSPTHRNSGVDAPLLTWQPAPGAVNYTVEVATTPAFGSSKVLTHAGITGTQDQLTASELTSGMVAYFWRVTAVGPNGTREAGNGPFWFSRPVSIPNPTAVAATNTRAVVAGDSAPGSVHILDLSTSGVLATLPAGTSPRGAAVSPNALFAMVTNQNTATLINVLNRSVIGDFPIGPAGSTLGDVLFTPDNSRVVMGETRTGNLGGVTLFNMANLAVGLHVPFNVAAAAQGLAVSADGRTVTAGLGGGQNARQLTLASGIMTQLTGFPGSFGVRSLAVPDLLGASASSVNRYSTATNGIFQQIPFAASTGFHNLEVTVDGSLAVVLGDSSVGVLDLGTHTVTHTIPVPGASYVALYTSPAGEVTALVTLPLQSQVRVLSLR